MHEMYVSTDALQASKWSTEDLYRHAAFCEEWLFRVCAPEPHPLGCRLEVVDLKGMRFTDIGAGWFSWCSPALQALLLQHVAAANFQP